MKNVESLLQFLKAEIESQKGVIEFVARLSRNPASTTTSGNEQIFNRHVLQPTIEAFFKPEFDNDQLRTGLLSEGMSQPHVQRLLPNHGEPPKSSAEFFYTKESLNQRLPPTPWTKGQKVRANRSYPDFAIRPPLLNTACLGELKWMKCSTEEEVVKQIYDLVDEAIFYLGVFMGEYQSAIIVIADGSMTNSLSQGYNSINSRIQKRFGRTSGIHLLRLTLR